MPIARLTGNDNVAGPLLRRARHIGFRLAALLAALGSAACGPFTAYAPKAGVPQAYACDVEACYRHDLPTYVPPDPFEAGRIDLTGDGHLEEVHRVGSEVFIYAGGYEVWRSPREWRVVDVALGDPNDDGRGEVLLAFWREDDTGVPRSHPFIVGYREGRYRTVWGGSAVAYPIYEMALGDVTGDGTEELIVLEAHGEVERSVSVWRWHGWGFSLIWRGEIARYQDLGLVYNEDQASQIIAVLALP